MTTDNTVELASLRFYGKRFEGHALDVECTQELIAYRTLVLECAKQLWRRRNPERTRLPKGFGEGFRLQFDRVVPGSAAVSLMRVREVVQGELDLGNDYDEAAFLIDSAIAAADRDDLLPDRLPANVIPLFGEFGRSLAPDEILYVRARGQNTEAAYTAAARARLAGWVGPTYADTVDLTGEVRMANLGPGTFRLQVAEPDALVDGRFDQTQEALVLDALKNHRNVRLRVKGEAEFSTRDRQIKRLTAVDSVTLAPHVDTAYDDTVIPIWEQLDSIGKQAPAGTWEAVPDDLSMRIDEIVYGQGERNQ